MSKAVGELPSYTSGAVCHRSQGDDCLPFYVELSSLH